ncbi:MAG TPA: hypothetical protein VF211_11085 [Burkholderiales bacterium]
MSGKKPDNPDTTIKNLNDPDVPEEFRELGPRPVDEAELVRWLTEQFQSYPECAAVTVEGLFRLELPDSEGCNWSRTLVLDPHGAPAPAYALAYAAIIEKARKAFVLA